jgi:hypothetical protein
MTEKTKAVSASAWKKATVHEGVTLPSGSVVDISVPNLVTMISSGELPNPLIDEAMKAQGGGPEESKELSVETLKDTWSFIRYIVPKMLVHPTISEQDVDDLPVEDVEMLAGFATRRNDIDAVGHHLGGLETHRRFRELRGLLTLDEALSSE